MIDMVVVHNFSATNLEKQQKQTKKKQQKQQKQQQQQQQQQHPSSGREGLSPSFTPAFVSSKARGATSKETKGRISPSISNSKPFRRTHQRSVSTDTRPPVDDVLKEMRKKPFTTKKASSPTPCENSQKSEFLLPVQKKKKIDALDLEEKSQEREEKLVPIGELISQFNQTEEKKTRERKTSKGPVVVTRGSRVRPMAEKIDKETRQKSEKSETRVRVGKRKSGSNVQKPPAIQLNKEELTRTATITLAQNNGTNLEVSSLFVNRWEGSKSRRGRKPSQGGNPRLLGEPSPKQQPTSPSTKVLLSPSTSISLDSPPSTSPRDSLPPENVAAPPSPSIHRISSKPTSPSLDPVTFYSPKNTSFGSTELSLGDEMEEGKKREKDKEKQNMLAGSSALSSFSGLTSLAQSLTKKEMVVEVWVGLANGDLVIFEVRSGGGGSQLDGEEKGSGEFELVLSSKLSIFSELSTTPRGRFGTDDGHKSLVSRLSSRRSSEMAIVNTTASSLSFSGKDELSVLLKVVEQVGLEDRDQVISISERGWVGIWDVAKRETLHSFSTEMGSISASSYEEEDALDWKSFWPSGYVFFSLILLLIPLSHISPVIHDNRKGKFRFYKEIILDGGVSCMGKSSGEVWVGSKGGEILRFSPLKETPLSKFVAHPGRRFVFILPCGLVNLYGLFVVLL